MFQQSVSIVALFAVVLATCSGCGPSRPAIAPVGGRVTYQGKPVAEGKIVFQPEHGRSAVGTIARDGSYRLTTFDPDDGALLGRHCVTIQAMRVTGVPQPKSFEEEVRGERGDSGKPAVVWLVPEKYSHPNTSPLTAEVKSGPNTIDFNLP